MAVAATPSRRARSPEALLLLASVVMLGVGNLHFLELALAGRAPTEAATWKFAAALVAALLAINFLLLAVLAWGRATKPVLAAVLLLAAGTAHFVHTFGTYIDPAMLRNAMHTHWAEARELLGWRLAAWLLVGGVLPAWWLWRQPLAPRRLAPALAWRGAAIGLALLVLGVALWSVFQPLASLMRNQRELRYLVTPGNVVFSALSLARRTQQEPAGPLLAVGTDARPGPSWPARNVPGATPPDRVQVAQAGLPAAVDPRALRRAPAAATGGQAAARPRPRVVVLVVGETARAANWGLSGYARPTTPELATLPVINFTGVTSCGTDTETSLPCMFSAIGRRQYDERRIRRSENLLHVAARAGVQVHWRDNQSGCKGVCDGFAQDTVSAVAPGLCADGHCLDEGLLHDLPALLRGPDRGSDVQGAAVRLVVLHQIGNHGPAYYRRVPPAFRHFQPACESDDLRQCSIESIVNAYDNALRYTDHVLATLIRRLQAEEVDAAVLYVSDHGESLGEHGLFLHGVPYAIAPVVQRQVPMVMWVSPGFAAARGLDTGCLAARSTAPGVSHDHLFHTILGLLDVHTAAREAPLDLTHGCTRLPLAGRALNAG